MRHEDITRVNMAKERLKSAISVLSAIREDDMNTSEDNFVRFAKELIKEADQTLDDILNIQK